MDPGNHAQYYYPNHYFPSTARVPPESTGTHSYNFVNQFAPVTGEPSTRRNPLSNRTNISDPSTTPVAASTQPKKRKKGPQAPGGRGATGQDKRPRLDPESATPSSSTPSSIAGCGPINLPAAEPTLHPQFHRRNGPSFSTRTSSGDTGNSKTSNATDVWYFVRGLHSVEPVPLPKTEELSVLRPDAKKFLFLGCRLCTGDDWTTWKNVTGQTVAIRKHLQTHHARMWRDVVITKKLKNWDQVDSSGPASSKGGEREAFTLDGFYDRLVKWTVVCDKAMNVIDTPELRDLLLYLGMDRIEDEDLPHRTKLTAMIMDRFQIEYKKMIHEITNSLGRISFTTDIWSRQDLDSFMAVTAHFLSRTSSGGIRLVSRLIAFRKLDGSHSGRNIGKVFVSIMKEVGVLHKISMITCDNAGNNGTGMVEIEVELKALGIPFEADGNRIRCFPHVVNIAVKHGLKELPNTPEVEESTAEEVKDYYNILQLDLVDSARKLVNACRASGQRRNDLALTIREGNEAGTWGVEKLNELTLLRDVDTRWSSTYLMIARLLDLDPAIQAFLARPKQSEITHYGLSDEEIGVLDDIRQYLETFHLVQELVSAEKTPTLSIVLPSYEKLIIALKNLKIKLPNLSHAIDASIFKLEEYLSLSRKTKMYAIAMALNPMVKLAWMKTNWSSTEYGDALSAIKATLTEYHRETDKSIQAASTTSSTTCSRSVTPPANNCPSPTQPSSVQRPGRRLTRLPSASSSALALAHGYARLDTLAGSDAPVSESSPTPMAKTPEDIARDVDTELARYEASGLIRFGHPEFDDFDIVQYWQRHRLDYPILFRAALDVLPVQASAVSCERVFSSSKETDALRRANLDPVLFEVLQILKYTLRQHRVDFVGNLVDTERRLEAIDICPSTIDNYIANGQVDELESLIDASFTQPETL